MSWALLFYGLVPLIAFVALDAWLGVKWAVLGAILFALLDILFMRYAFHQWDPLSFLALGLFVILGVVSIRADNELFFKLQPTILEVIFAGYVLYAQYVQGGFLERFLPVIKAAAPAAIRDLIDQPQMLAMLHEATGAMAIALLVHAALVAWTAVRGSNIAWLLMRSVGFWVLIPLASVCVALRHAVLGS